MLGRAVVARLAPDHELVAVDLPDGDLTEAAAVERLFMRHDPTWVVHTAAFTAVDDAETRRDEAMAGNALATENVAAACARHGAGLTYLSTDYVFPGTGEGYDEDDARDPVNYYGLTKARGEEVVEKLHVPWQIVRTSWLFGDGPANFVLTIRRLLSQRDTLQVVDDQQGCPTFAPDLAAVLHCLVGRRATGYYHGTNTGDCNWCEFAREIARLSGADPQRVHPCATAAYPTPAKRPACSILRSRNLEAVGCEAAPHWRDALARYVATLSTEPRAGKDT